MSSNGLSLPIILHFLGWGLRGAGGDEKVDEQQSLGARLLAIKLSTDQTRDDERISKKKEISRRALQVHPWADDL